MPWMRRVCPYLLIFHQLDELAVASTKPSKKEIEELKTSIAKTVTVFAP